MRLQRRAYLDPRPAADAQATPIRESVNIPLEELHDRMSELPPKEEVIQVASTQPLADIAVKRLQDLGRQARATKAFEHGANQGIGRLWEPNEWLIECIAQLQPGRALDLGCGAGRDAAYLAAEGWKVFAVDRLPDCLDRGRALAERYLPQDDIQWITADALSPEFQPEGRFDLIVSAFLFDRTIPARATDWLRPGGSLIIEAFTTIRQAKEGKPSSPDRVVKPGEMAELLSGFEIVQIEEGEQKRGHTARAWARKRS